MALHKVAFYVATATMALVVTGCSSTATTTDALKNAAPVTTATTVNTGPQYDQPLHAELNAGATQWTGEAPNHDRVEPLLAAEMFVEQRFGYPCSESQPFGVEQRQQVIAQQREFVLILLDEDYWPPTDGQFPESYSDRNYFTEGSILRRSFSKNPASEYPWLTPPDLDLPGICSVPRAGE